MVLTVVLFVAQAVSAPLSSLDPLLSGATTARETYYINHAAVPGRIDKLIPIIRANVTLMNLNIN